MIFEIDIGCTV